MDSLKAKADKIKKLFKTVEKQAVEPFKPPSDPVQFCREILHFHPYSYQERLLADGNHFIAVRWCRQSGKSCTVAAKAAAFASTRPKSTVIVTAPSFDQAKIFLNHVHSHIFNIKPPIRAKLILEQLKTVVKFRNGSVILAEAPDPYTIRGHKADMVIVDEMNFIRDDRDLYLSGLLPMLNTTGGYLIACSTPWHTDSIFYRMCFDPAFSQFSRHHTTWSDAVEPHGPLKRNILEMLREQYAGDPWRWKREMEAVYAEDENAFFRSSLIVKCIDHNLHYIEDDAKAEGRFYVGVDLAKKVDYSVIAVLSESEQADGVLRLIWLKRLPHGTSYAVVNSYVDAACRRLQTVQQILYDQTGVGEAVLEEARRSVTGPLKGVTLTEKTKQDILNYMKMKMQQCTERCGNGSGECPHPRMLQFPRDDNLIAEMNIETFELTPSGQIKFNHPPGSHDDRLWALALAVYATRNVESTQTYKGIVSR